MVRLVLCGQAQGEGFGTFARLVVAPFQRGFLPRTFLALLCPKPPHIRPTPNLASGFIATLKRYFTPKHYLKRLEDRLRVPVSRIKHPTPESRNGWPCSAVLHPGAKRKELK